MTKLIKRKTAFDCAVFLFFVKKQRFYLIFTDVFDFVLDILNFYLSKTALNIKIFWVLNKVNSRK